MLTWNNVTGTFSGPHVRNLGLRVKRGICRTVFLIKCSVSVCTSEAWWKDVCPCGCGYLGGKVKLEFIMMISIIIIISLLKDIARSYSAPILLHLCPLCSFPHGAGFWLVERYSSSNSCSSSCARDCFPCICIIRYLQNVHWFFWFHLVKFKRLRVMVKKWPPTPSCINPSHANRLEDVVTLFHPSVPNESLY